MSALDDLEVGRWIQDSDQSEKIADLQAPHIYRVHNDGPGHVTVIADGQDKEPLGPGEGVDVEGKLIEIRRHAGDVANGFYKMVT